MPMRSPRSSLDPEEVIVSRSACEERGVHVVLSIDGMKKSGRVLGGTAVPDGLFERDVSVDVGRSMLRRFQREGSTLEDEVVHD